MSSDPEVLKLDLQCHMALSLVASESMTAAQLNGLM